MLNKKFTLVATLMATLATTSVMAEQKADTKFVDDSSYAIGVLMGKNIEGIVEKQKDVFTYNEDKILAGVQDTLKKTGKLTDDDLQKQLKSLDSYLVSQEQKISAEKAEKAKVEGEKLRTEYAKQAGVKKTSSGLLYKIEKTGEGTSPSKTDMVTVHYEGTLPDGTVFDSSYERNTPIEFQLNQLIPGWIEAIPMLKKGGKMEIVVPPELGYGNRPAGKIPANSTLKFKIELLDFKPAK